MVSETYQDSPRPVCGVVSGPDLNLTPLAAFLRFLPSLKEQQKVADLNRD